MTPEALNAAAIQGGVEIDAVFLDGTKERVKVRYFPRQLFSKLIDVVEIEPASVELFCDMPAGWSNGLTDDSFLEILTTGRELNLERLLAWASRTFVLRQQLSPAIGKAEQWLVSAARSKN
jgi:hypothetical protein